MSNSRPTGAAKHQQPSSKRSNTGSAWNRNEVDQQHPIHQVDSWRSYRNDTTNLQQIAYQASQLHDYQAIYQQPIGHDALNPAASSFVPINTNPVNVPTQHQTMTQQPLRAGNGKQDKRNIYQARSNTPGTSNNSGGRYNLRSRPTLNNGHALQDVPLPSIEHARQFSSVPANIITRPGANAFRRVTPRHTSVSATPPPTPSPTKAYLNQARLPPSSLPAPQKLLIVLDLNGTLLKRASANRSNFSLRPGVTNFMEYLLENHVVMIYSSARPENVQRMVEKLLEPIQRSQLVAVWGRDKLGLSSAQYNSKVQVYKKLDKIWNDKTVQERAGKGRKWDQTNTVLIDDTHLKAAAQPYNLLKVEEFVNDRPAASDGQTKEYMEALNQWISEQQKTTKDLENRLEGLKWTADVSQLIRKWQSLELVNDHSAEENEMPEQNQLLTPKSPDPVISEEESSDGGVDYRQNDIDDLVQKIKDQRVDGNYERAVSDRGVSPIDENVWKEILGNVEQNEDGPLSPTSLRE